MNNLKNISKKYFLMGMLGLISLGKTTEAKAQDKNTDKQSWVFGAGFNKFLDNGGISLSAGKTKQIDKLNTTDELTFNWGTGFSHIESSVTTIGTDVTHKGEWDHQESFGIKYTKKMGLTPVKGLTIGSKLSGGYELKKLEYHNEATTNNIPTVRIHEQKNRSCVNITGGVFAEYRFGNMADSGVAYGLIVGADYSQSIRLQKLPQSNKDIQMGMFQPHVGIRVYLDKKVRTNR